MTLKTAAGQGFYWQRNSDGAQSGIYATRQAAEKSRENCTISWKF